MTWTALVTCLSVVLYLFQTGRVAGARAKYGIAAPAISGNLDFERVFRVHQNTLEALIIFLPALWLFAWYVSDLWAAAFGVVWLIGRVIYTFAYYADAAKRGPGATITGVATAALLIGALAGILLSLFRG
jgi:glutathione S-transferase